MASALVLLSLVASCTNAPRVEVAGGTPSPTVSSSDAKTEVSQSAPTTGFVAPYPPSSPPGTAGSARVAGIDATRQGPFFGGEFAVTTRYAGPFGVASWIEVYAGSTKDNVGNPAHAALRIYMDPLDEASTNPTVYVGDFVAPGHAISAQILSISGTTLMLALDANGTISFDLTTHKFR
jgi:hypothetical protein